MKKSNQQLPFDAAFAAICKREKINQAQAARRLDISAAYLSDVLNGKRRVSLPLALRLEDHFGFDAQTVLEWQVAQDVKQARGRK